MNIYKQLETFYDSLSKYGNKQIDFHNLGVRDRDHNGSLQRPFFAIASFLSQRINSQTGSCIIMVTASHNPPDFNGLKISALNQDIEVNESELNNMINNKELTLKFLQELCKLPEKQGTFYIGRDKRLTSQKLSFIIRNTLTILGKNVIDLGQRTTPQVFSLSEYIDSKIKYPRQLNKIVVEQYFHKIRNAFQLAIKEISQNKQITWKNKKLCFDLANGVGGQSLKSYSFIKDFFDFNIINDHEFSKPNVQSGADWFYSTYKQLNVLANLQNYPKADEYYFFDGDSDRIIGYFQGETQPFDGDDFNACFSRLLAHLFSSINLNQKIGSIANFTSNRGLQTYLLSLNIVLQKVAVGVKPLFNAAKKHQICCYFQNSGHGCLYFSQEIRQKLRQLSEKYWQARLLLLLDELSLNNSRGYALHNMLILQIYLFYFGQKKRVFEKSYLLLAQYPIKDHSIFVNGKKGFKVLQKPFELKDIIDKFTIKYKEVDISLRKSSTSSLLRLTMQGDRALCESVKNEINKQIIEAINKIQNKG